MGTRRLASRSAAYTARNPSPPYLALRQTDNISEIAWGLAHALQDWDELRHRNWTCGRGAWVYYTLDETICGPRLPSVPLSTPRIRRRTAPCTNRYF